MNRTAKILLFSVIFLFFLFFHTKEILQRNEKRMGMYLKQSEEGVYIEQIEKNSPAKQAGLKEGDILLKVAHIPVHVLDDYDNVDQVLQRGKPVPVEISRKGKKKIIYCAPGMPFPYFSYLVNLLCALAYSFLAFWLFFQGDQRKEGNLLGIFATLVAWEMVLPQSLNIGTVDIEETLFFALSFGQFFTESYLCFHIPYPHPLLQKRKLLGTVFLVFFLCCLGFLGIVLGNALSLVPYALLEKGYFLFDSVFLPLWALILAGILLSRFRENLTFMQKQRVYLVLLGSLPWILIVFYLGALAWLNLPFPGWLNKIWSWILLPLPIALFVAIFKYHLFRLGKVVQKGFVFTALLFLSLSFMGFLWITLYYLAGQNLIRTPSLWVFFIAASFFWGLFSLPLFRWIEKKVENKLFPEKKVVRERLLNLANTLPLLGSMESMGKKLQQELSAILSTQNCYIFLTDPHSQTLYPLEEHLPTIPVDDPLITQMIIHRKSYNIQNEKPMPSSMLYALCLEKEIVLILPLMVADTLTGVLLLGKRQDGSSYLVEEMDLLQLFAQHVALAFDHVKVVTWATYDGLTGLYRREKIVEVLQQESTRALRYGRPLSIIFLDMDNLKAINDTLGHPQGDLVLKGVAKILSRSFRLTDAVGRFGGDEFLVICPETPLSEAEKLAERVLTHIHTKTLLLPKGEVTLSFSAGIIGFTLKDPTPSPTLIDFLIPLADELLYEAKGKGGNTFLSKEITEEISHFLQSQSSTNL